MKRLRTMLCVLAIAASLPVLGQDDLTFVPVVRDAIVGYFPLANGAVEQRSWFTSSYVRNLNDHSSTYLTVPFFAPPCPGATRTIQANSAARTCLPEFRYAVDFFALALPQGTTVSAEMVRQSDRRCATGTDQVSLGRVPLPTFRGLYPAGTKTVTNHVELGASTLVASCSELPRDFHRRRVNITLANGGTEKATFRVRIERLLTGVLVEREFTLDGRQVAQFNGIEPTGIEGNSEDYNQQIVWISVTADQPYIGYVSSLFDGGGPDTMPLEVFPLRAVQ